MRTSSKEVTLAVGNMITGVYNYIVLSIPLDWKIIVVPMDSDVFSSRRQGGVKWVREGEVEHGVSTPMGSIGVRVRIWPGRKDHGKLSREAEKIYELQISGHSGKAYVYRTRAGFKKHRTLGISFYCDVTDRSLLIEFVGGGEWVDAVLKSIGGSMCHVQG